MSAVLAGTPPQAYDDWATLYDRSVGPEYGDAQWRFLQRVLLPAVPPGATLLDLCCGTGLLMQPLLAAGYRLTGLDLSAGMLDIARRNAPGARLLQADARDFTLPQPVHGAFSTSASLNHIDSLADLQQVFASVHRALQPGGVFTFDLNHPAQLQRWWRGVPYEGQLLDSAGWLITPRYDAATRRGAFRVTTFHAPQGRASGPLRRRLYQLLARPRFIGLRLALLQRLQWIEPRWTRSDVDHPIVGHELADVQQALRAAGFIDIRIETVDGAALDDRHAAHVIARKPLP